MNLTKCIICGNLFAGVINIDNVNNVSQYGLTESVVTGQNNWWGANNGPSGMASGSGDPVTNGVTYDPWLVMNLSTSSNRILIGGVPAIITAHFLNNSMGVDTSSTGFLPNNRLNVIFYSTYGGFVGGQNEIVPVVNSTASAVLTSGDMQVTTSVCAYTDCNPNITMQCLSVEFYGYVGFEIDKVAGKFTYDKKENITYTITIRNNGNSNASNVIITDSFPKELEFVSSRPAATVSDTSIKFPIGNLNIGESAKVTAVFKVANRVNISEKGLTINNVATVDGKNAITGAMHTSTDNATIFIPSQQSPDNLELNVTWKGIETKTSIAKAGAEIGLEVKVKGGSAPYTIECTFDKQNRQASVIDGPEKRGIFKHTFNQSGSYLITLICTDNFGSSKRVERMIYVR